MARVLRVDIAAQVPERSRKPFREARSLVRMSGRKKSDQDSLKASIRARELHERIEFWLKPQL